MAGESGKQRSLNKEDLLSILEKAKDIGNSKTDITAQDFVKAIESQLIRAMTKPDA